MRFNTYIFTFYSLLIHYKNSGLCVILTGFLTIQAHNCYANHGVLRILRHVILNCVSLVPTAGAAIRPFLRIDMRHRAYVYIFLTCLGLK